MLECFHGIYWDNIFMSANYDTVAGGAWVDEQGRVHPSMGLWAMRDLIRRAPQTTNEWRLLIARMKLHLGDLLAGQPEGATEAEGLFRDALRTQGAVLGPLNLALSHGLGALASVLEAQRRFAEAESLVTRRVELYRALLGDEHISTITARTPLASLRVEHGRLAEAEAIRAEAL